MRNSPLALAILTALSAQTLLMPRASSQQAGASVRETATAPSPDGRGAVLYDQTQSEYPDSALSFDASGSTGGFGTDTSFAADDFFITDPNGWTVYEVDIDGTFNNTQGQMAVAFYPDVRGLPGSTAICSYRNIENYSAPGGNTIRRFLVPLPTGCHLPPGENWVSVYGSGRFTAQGGYYWGTFSPATPLGNEAVWKNPSDGFGIGCQDWTPLTECEFTTTALGFAILGDGIPTSFDEIFSNGFDSSTGVFVQPVLDPGFEHTSGDGESNPYWLSQDGNPSAPSGGTVFYSDVSYPIPVYQGQWEVWFGGWDNDQAETQTVSQTFTIAGGGPRYLHYWRYIQAPPVGSGMLTISVDGTAVSTTDLAAAGADTDFGEHVIDLSNYADTRPHTIGLEYDYGGGGSDGRIFIDQVTMSDTANIAASAGAAQIATPVRADRKPS